MQSTRGALSAQPAAGLSFETAAKTKAILREMPIEETVQGGEMLSRVNKRQRRRQDVRESSLGLRKNEARKLFAQGLGPRCLISLVPRRGFHSSLVLLAESKSDKPPTCQSLNQICKEVEERSDQPCKKPDLCRREKIKCVKSEQHQLNKAQKAKPKIVKMVEDPMCTRTCLSKGKCEMPQTAPPPKMEYAKVTCPPPKYLRPDPCPLMPERHENDGPHIEAKQVTPKKATCSPPPLPKPPYGPILLCPCAPPRKVRPGPCPCYEQKVVQTRPLQPCPLKKKYPCPDMVHVCSIEKKPCNLKRTSTCEHRKRKQTPAS